MIKNVSFFVFAFFLSAVSFAQISTFYQTDSVKIKGIVSDKPAYKLVNYDEDGFWSRLDTFYINYDDDLNILNTVAHNEEFEIKLDNKLYSLKKATHEKYDDPTDSSSSITILDSVYLLCYNLKTHTLTSRNLPKMLNYEDSRITYLKSKNVFAVALTKENVNEKVANYSQKLCLTTIDTAGNVLKFKDFNMSTVGFCIAEQGNKILINSYRDDDEGKLYIIDNVSLRVIDSMTSSYALFLRVVNDSIVIQNGSSDYVATCNTISKTVKTNYIRQETNVLTFPIYDRYPLQNHDLNLRNLDSIFLCYNISRNISKSEKELETEEIGLKIVNFSHNGDINFSYIFNGFEPNSYKLPYGVVCTRDGGIIITVVSSLDNKDMSSYLLKINPKGNISKVKSLKK